jgi:hypothetical protein
LFEEFDFHALEEEYPEFQGMAVEEWIIELVNTRIFPDSSSV